MASFRQQIKTARKLFDSKFLFRFPPQIRSNPNVKVKWVEKNNQGKNLKMLVELVSGGDSSRVVEDSQVSKRLEVRQVQRGAYI
jgi:hypothetical protein